MSKLERLKVVLAKTEATYGTDAAPTGVANAMLLQNWKMTPLAAQDVKRKRELPFFAAPDNYLAGEYVEMSFDVELIGNAAKGTVPRWSALAQACGLGETAVAATSVTYNPVSSGHKSATIHFYMDGLKHSVTGCRAKDAKIKLDVLGLPMLSVTMWGLYNEPVDVANPAATLTGFPEPELVSNANTPVFAIGGVALPLRSFELDIGNRTVLRELVGSKEIIITDREAVIAATVELQPVATFNPFALAFSKTSQAVVLTHGTAANRIVTINAATARMNKPGAYTEQDGVVEQSLALSCRPNAGSDEFSIVLT